MTSPRRLAALALSAIASACAADEKVSYNEHIRPLLANNCFACHGVDAAHRKGKLRLDTFEGATAERDGVRALVPGSLEKSELWQRIISPHDDEIMPPPEAHKPPLTAEQREHVRRWILQGGEYQRHWSFEPVARVALPPAAGGAADHPVDRFIGAKLASQKLKLSPEAPRDVLFRRLTLDLTGLPPTPEETDAFLADTQPGAYDRAVERLLASPRYGEQFGRHWLDAVRYADTHGLHLDNIRMIWPYRDWVVAAFNRNLPFDQFTIEQLAGDLLPAPRTDQRVASGFNRNHLTTSEGGAIEAEAEMRNTADRVDTTMAVWQGLTANCASCHDHKFDPISQREYYALGAIFKGLADRPWDGNVRLPGPIAVIGDTPEKQRRIDRVAADVQPLEQALTAAVEHALANTHELLTLAKKPIAYEVIWADDSDVLAPRDFPNPVRAGTWREGADVPVVSGRRALRLDGTVVRPITFTTGDVTLTVRGDVKAFVHFQPDAARPPRAISLEFVSEEKTQRVVWGDPAAFGPDVAQAAVVAGPLPAPGAYAKLEIAAVATGIKTGKAYTGLRLAQSDGAGWWDLVGAVNSTPSASDDPLLSSAAWASGLRSNARFVEGVPIRHDIKFLIGLSPTQQNEEEKARLARFHRDYIYGPLRGAVEREAHAVRALLSEQIHHELSYPGTLISRERAEPLPAHVLIRGQYDKPGERVAAALPAFLSPPEKPGARLTRLDLARWLVDARNPLTARVTVNRFWAQLFGAGLVRTPGDFGAQGEAPTHPALLDWLAGEFVRSGWDVKALVRLLVTSRTYRQSSAASPALVELDPENKLLARASRPRLDAEVLRDQALAIGALLVPRIGGPPVRPYQPINIWEPVAFGGSNTKVYVQDSGPALYRRSIYSFWKRTAPAPSMSTFDAPSRENFCVGRARSNTPLQALALMNDVQHFEAARGFAERLLKRTSTEEARLDYAFRCVTARPPTGPERALLADNLAAHRAHFARNLDAAQQAIGNGESKPDPALPAGEVAAWTMVANLLLNLDEAIVRN